MPKLQTEFGYKNVNQIPKVEKIVINIGLGEATTNPKLVERAVDELARISGPEAGRAEVEEEHRELQAARGPGDRRAP